MNTNPSRTYSALLAVSGLFALAALLTLVPNPSAHWPNAVGYRSLCTFAPVSTALCALLAAAACTVRSRLFKPAARRGWQVPVVAGIVLAALLAFSSVRYATARVDATSGASAAAAVPGASEG